MASTCFRVRVFLRGLVFISTCICAAGFAGAETSPARRNEKNGVCDAIVLAAKEFRLPEPFFLRLIWRESRFDPKAVSSAGAMGIAQFMPATAQWRGLDDPFDWPAAIRHSGRWLRELRLKFGNLGLAAAAYNAGPGRVQDWLAGARELPQETRDYVRMVTGRNAEDWIGLREPGDGLELSPNTSECPPRGVAASAVAAHPGRLPGARAPSRAWALQLVGDRSKATAIQQYASMRHQFASILGSRSPEVVPRRIGGRFPTYWYQVRVSEASRQSATLLCDRLKSAGGQCLVIRN
jgi:hypothetical protein